jgi:hypothetical protein
MTSKTPYREKKLTAITLPAFVHWFRKPRTLQNSLFKSSFSFLVGGHELLPTGAIYIGGPKVVLLLRAKHLFVAAILRPAE